jgi:poly(3-hydroxybutyrate) depolymerase
LTGEINDIKFANDLLDYIKAEYCIDTSCVYATGFSNGGGLTDLLACNIGVSARLAAVAIASGAVYKDSALKEPLFNYCMPSHVLPIMEFHKSKTLSSIMAVRPLQMGSRMLYRNELRSGRYVTAVTAGRRTRQLHCSMVISRRAPGVVERAKMLLSTSTSMALDTGGPVQFHWRMTIRDVVLLISTRHRS